MDKVCFRFLQYQLIVVNLSERKAPIGWRNFGDAEGNADKVSEINETYEYIYYISSTSQHRTVDEVRLSEG